MIRSISAGIDPGWGGVVILLVYQAAFTLLSVLFIYKKKNL